MSSPRGVVQADMLAKLDAIPEPTGEAIDYFTNTLKEYFKPVYLQLSEYLHASKLSNTADNTTETNLVLFLSLASKYIQIMKEIFKSETVHNRTLEESRNWIVERIKWTLKCTDDLLNQKSGIVLSACLNYDGDEFVTHIDKALDTLDNIKNNFENDSEKENFKHNASIWKVQCTTYIFNLHSQIKDTITAAMKIYQNCLSSDQSIIMTRCHVVFRELKKFLCELTLKTDFNLDDFTVKVEDIKPKTDLHYPTIRLLSDVLKDAVYNLEAAINRSVLGLVLHCMIDPLPPIVNILEHVKLRKDKKCDNSDSDFESLLESFDIHIERIFHIGMFSISCSADKKRIFLMKKCLATLEDLEIQLVPSVLSNPLSVHTEILLKQWAREMNALKLLVFLIIDPVAFTDLVMEKFRCQLLKMKNDGNVVAEDVKYLIALGKCMSDYIDIYETHEPNSLPNSAKVLSYKQDLHKALNECSAVCNKFFVQGGASEPNELNEKKVLKRLKLLYSILSNISQQIMEDMECSETDGNSVDVDVGLTYVNKDNANTNTDVSGENKNETYNMLCDANNATHLRSTIMRRHMSSDNHSTTIKRNSLSSRYFYKIHKGDCVCNSASFFSSSAQHEEYLLANISEEDKKLCNNFLQETLRENTKNLHSRFKRNQRRSLRKTLLLNKVKNNAENVAGADMEMLNEKYVSESMDKKEEVVSQTSGANDTDWHITEILEQLTQLSSTLSVMNIDIERQLNDIGEEKNNTFITNIKVNTHPYSSPKSTWNIKLSGSSDENVTVKDETMILDVNKNDNGKQIGNETFKDNFTLNCGIDVSFDSNVGTPERMKDINDLEDKLAALKQFWKES